MTLSNWLRGLTVAAMVCGGGWLYADDEAEERVIQLGPAGVGQQDHLIQIPRTVTLQSQAAIQLSDYMIGVSATPVSDEVRAQVDLPDGAGLLVGEVIDDGPAAKAGVERYDILVRADGDKLKSMEQLIDAVDRHGKDESALAIEVLRKGETVNVEITPTKRPKIAAAESGSFNVPVPRVQPLPPEVFAFRGLGPMVMGVPGAEGHAQAHAHGMVAAMPNGVSIQIQKQDDQPAKITIKRGEEEWTVEGDDEEALAELPDDLRPAVENMLKGAQGGGGQMFNIPVPPMPNQPDNLMFRWAVPGAATAPAPGLGGVEEQLKEMQRQIDELRKALEDAE